MLKLTEKLKNWRQKRRILRARKLLTQIVEDDETAIDHLFDTNELTNKLEDFVYRKFDANPNWLLNQTEIDKLVEVLEHIPLKSSSRFELITELLRIFNLQFLESEKLTVSRDLSGILVDTISKKDFLNLIILWTKAQSNSDLSIISFLANKEIQGVTQKEVFNSTLHIKNIFRELGINDNQIKIQFIDLVEKVDFVKLYREKFNLNSDKESLMHMIIDWEASIEGSGFEVIAYIARKHIEGGTNKKLFGSLSSIEALFSATGFGENHLNNLLTRELEKDDILKLYQKVLHETENNLTIFLLGLLRYPDRIKEKSIANEIVQHFGFSFEEMLGSFDAEQLEPKQIIELYEKALQASDKEKDRILLRLLKFRDAKNDKSLAGELVRQFELPFRETLNAFTATDLDPCQILEMYERATHSSKDERALFLINSLKSPVMMSGKFHAEKVVQHFGLTFDDTRHCFEKELSSYIHREGFKSEKEWLSNTISQTLSKYDQKDLNEWIGFTITNYIKREQEIGFKNFINSLKKLDKKRYCILELDNGLFSNVYGDKFSLDDIFIAHSLDLEYVIDTYREKANEYFKKRKYINQEEWLNIPLENLVDKYFSKFGDAFLNKAIEVFLASSANNKSKDVLSLISALTDHKTLLLNRDNNTVTVHGEKFYMPDLSSFLKLCQNIFEDFDEKVLYREILTDILRNNRFRELYDREHMTKFIYHISRRFPTEISTVIEEDGKLLEHLHFSNRNAMYWERNPTLFASYKKSDGFRDSLINDLEIVSKLIQNEAFIEKIFSFDSNINEIFFRRVLVNRIHKDKELFDTILHNSGLFEKFWKKAESQFPELGLKGYPYFLVSYPRSGSNFLQNLLEKSTGFNNQSIYSPLIVRSNLTMTLKSHAPSFDYLEQEVEGLVGLDDLQESKYIILVRDPRDVMISFYEYVKAKRKIEITQNKFLNGVDFFYASTIDKQFIRKSNVSPISVIQAYRMFIKNWVSFSKNKSELCLFLRYEDLTENPTKFASNVLNFVGQNNQLRTEALDEIVSLYSTEDRPRGQAFGWKKVKKRYATLIEQVEKKLSKEIEQLGY